MVYGFNDDKSKVEMYSKSQIDTKVSDDTEVDVLYFKFDSDKSIDASVKLSGVDLNMYLLSSEYSGTLRRKFRCSNYTFVVSEIKLAYVSGSHTSHVSGLTIGSIYFGDSGSQPVLHLPVWASNATSALSSISITASVSYVKVLAIPNSRITDPRT